MGEEFVGLLKVYFPSKEANENGEHMWIEPISRDVNSITGKLLSIPEWIDYVEAGDVVTVTVEDVTDWLYVEGGMAKGAVTVNLLRSRMTLDERRAHDEQYPFRFD
ncbi:MAG: DUF2314 domain-containing protein [Verrucomicrobia bacterium]|nr:DUF2314 domain-containing protein [Verrucomicrobiota bacterium]